MAGQRIIAAPEDAPEGRVVLDDRAIGIQQRLADRRVLHGIAEALLAATEALGHVRCDASRACFGGSQHPGQCEQQQRNGDPRQQQLVERGELRCRGFGRPGEEIEAPTPAVEPHRQAVGEGMRRIDAAVLVQHVMPGVGDVDHPHLHLAAPRGKSGMQHVVHAERRQHPATDGTATRRRRIHIQRLAIYRREQHQCGRRSFRIPAQDDLAGELRLATLHRHPHRPLAHRFRIQVEADRIPVQIGMRLQVQDRPVAITSPAWPQFEQATPVRPPRFLELHQPMLVQGDRVTHANQRRERCLQLQRVDVTTPLFGRGPVQRRE